MAIRVSGLDYKALVAYLCEGVTWSRLKYIATKDLAHGGIWALHGHVSAAQGPLFLFGISPSAIIVTKPEHIRQVPQVARRQGAPPAQAGSERPGSEILKC